MDFTLDPEESWARCEHCRKRLRPLAKYKPEDVVVNAPGLGGLEQMKGCEGMVFSAILTFFAALFSCITESAVTRYRRRKVARLRGEILPHFAKSLICPSCLKVVRKR